MSLAPTLRYQARALPQNLNPSAWLAMLPPRRETPPLERDVSCDIAIIGAGFAGLAAARKISQSAPELKVVVLEALAIAEGACGRNSGFLIDLPHDVSADRYADGAQSKARNEIFINRTAIALARDMAQEQGWSKDILDPCGKFSVAIGADGDMHLQDYAQTLAALGEPHQRLDHAEIESITGSARYTSGLFTPGGVMIQPAAYMRAFADALAPAIRLFERSPVLEFRQEPAGWLLKTPKGNVRAAKIILANNGHAESFGLYTNKLLHIFTFASMTEPFDPALLKGQRQWGATPAHPMGTSVRRISTPQGDRILIRSRYSYHPSIELAASDLAGAGRIHRAKFVARFPGLQHLRMDYCWGGAMALTWNGVPAFGEVAPGLFTAIACNGVGGTKATSSGLAAAERALGQDSQLTRLFDAMQAPKPLPPQPFRTLGVKASLAMRHWKAGAQ